jgi:hypothetical protein
MAVGVAGGAQGPTEGASGGARGWRRSGSAWWHAKWNRQPPTGASSLDPQEEGLEGGFGCPLRVGARLGILLECIFFCSQPLLLSWGSSRGSAGVALKYLC